MTAARSDGLVIRRSEPGDDRALAELDAASWPLELQVVAPQAAQEPFFGPQRAPADVIVALDDDVLVGYVRIARHMRIDSNAHVLHLDALVVSPAARGRGAGSRLIDAAIAEARTRGARKLGLRALSINENAIRLYERHGFELEGRLRGEFLRPDGSYADDLWFALML